MPFTAVSRTWIHDTNGFVNNCRRLFGSSEQFEADIVDIHRLPYPGSVSHRHLDAHRVGKLHLVDFRLQPEREFVESQLQHISQPSGKRLFYAGGRFIS